MQTPFDICAAILAGFFSGASWRKVPGFLAATKARQGRFKGETNL